MNHYNYNLVGYFLVSIDNEAKLIETDVFQLNMYLKFNIKNIHKLTRTRTGI